MSSGVKDVNPGRAAERERQESERQETRSDEAKPEKDAAEELKKLMELKSGGRYIPPARLRALQEQIEASKSPKAWQRIEWDKLKKKINGLINKANKDNIKSIVMEMFEANLDRGRGSLVRSLMKAQSSSLVYTNVYACLAAVLNSKLPKIGDLLAKRLIIQFRKAFKRNDKSTCLSSSFFIAHLTNQRVVHEIVCLQMLQLLLAQPTDDTVEIAVGFIREVGACLQEVSPSATSMVFERFRAILHEDDLHKRTQYMIEVLFQTRKEGYLENPPIAKELDLVEEDEQITHMLELDDPDLKNEDMLNVFRFDPDYEANEKRYQQIKEEILGGDDDGSEDEDSDAPSEDEAEQQQQQEQKTDGQGNVIKDMTQSESRELQKRVYLTVMSSMSSEEMTHKLMKIQVPEGNEWQLANMIAECCAQDKVFNKQYAFVAIRMCKMRKHWREMFERSFRHYVEIMHRYQEYPISLLGMFFGRILANDAISWEVFDCLYVDVQNSTAATRVFIKFMLQEMREEMGMPAMLKQFQDPYIQSSLVNMFPTHSKSKCTWAINFYTAIKMGPLTDDLRRKLDDIPESPPQSPSSSSSSRSRPRSSSRSSYSTGSSRSRSRSRTPSRSPRGRRQSRSLSKSRSRSRSRSQSGSRSDRSYSSRSRSGSRSSYSRSPSGSPRQRRARSYSRSRSKSRSRSQSQSQSRSRSGSQTPPRTSAPKSRSKSSPPPKEPKDQKEAAGDTEERGRKRTRSPTPEKEREYTPPPRRPQTWDEVGKKEVNNRQSPVHEKKRARAADYL